MAELVRHENVLGKIYTVVGDDGTDIILNSKGNVKVRFGNSFLNLIKNGKISADSVSSSGRINITTVTNTNEITKDGIYYCTSDESFYISLGGILFKLNTEIVENDPTTPGGEGSYTNDKYLSIVNSQRLRPEQIELVLDNINQVITYLTDNINDLPDSYPIYVTSEGKHYRKYNNELEELYLNLKTGGTVQGQVNIGTGYGNYPQSKFNIISNTPITLYDGTNNNVQIIFSDSGIQFIVNGDRTNTIRFNKNGIGINTIPNEQLEIIGNQIIQGILKVLPGRIIAEDIGSEVFFPGFTGEGFRIYKDNFGNYNAEFDNLTVRQTMRIYELVLEKIRAVKGAMIISQGGEIIKSVSIITQSVRQLDIDVGTGNSYIPTTPETYIEKEMYAITFEENYHVFKANDLIRCQVFKYGNVKGYWVWVRDVNSTTIFIDTDQFDEYNYPEEGDEIVQLGSTVDYYRQSAIYLSASDTINPIIDILSGINKPSFEGCIRTRLGNLQGVTYGNVELEGYGLFSDNVYLTGKLHVIGGDGETVDLENSITNAIDLRQASKLQYLYTNDDYIAIYNGIYEIGETYRAKTTEFIKTPNMKNPEYYFDSSNPDNPIDAYYQQWEDIEFNISGKEGDFYICRKGITLAPITYVHNGSSWVLCSSLAADDSLRYSLVNLISQDGREVPPLEIYKDSLVFNIVSQLKLTTSTRTLFASDGYPNCAVKDGDYLIHPKEGKIYICIQSSDNGGSAADWVESNIAANNIRSDIALNLGYDSYDDLVHFAQTQNTIIRGGYINTYLLDAEIVIGNIIAGDYMKSQKIEIWSGETNNTLAWRFDNTAILGGIVTTVNENNEVVIESYSVKFLPDGTMFGVKSGTNESDPTNNPWRFNKDGSGSLAFNNIRWDTTGIATFGNGVLSTTIDGNAISSTNIYLGEGTVNSGVSGAMTQTGVNSSNDLIRFWAGGTLEDAINTVNGGNGAPFVVTNDGRLFASNADIEGAITIGIGSYIGDKVSITSNGLFLDDYNDVLFGSRDFMVSQSVYDTYMGVILYPQGSSNRSTLGYLGFGGVFDDNNNDQLYLHNQPILKVSYVNTSGIRCKTKKISTDNTTIDITPLDTVLIIENVNNIILNPVDLSDGHLLFIVNLSNIQPQITGDYIASPQGGGRDRSTRIGEMCIKSLVYYQGMFYTETDYKD